MAAMAKDSASQSEVLDSELVQAARLGDRAAFEEIYCRYQVYVRQCVRRFLQQDEMDDAADVAQEIWLALAEGEWQLSPDHEGPLGAFITTIARRAVYQHRLRSKTISRTEAGETVRRQWTGLPSMEGYDADTGRPVRAPAALVTMFDPVDEIHQRQMTAKVMLAIAQLPEVQQRLITWRFIELLPVRDICARVDRSDPWVRTQIRIARQAICAAVGVDYQPGFFRARSSDDRVPYHDAKGLRRDRARSGRIRRYRAQIAAAREQRARDAARAVA